MEEDVVVRIQQVSENGIDPHDIALLRQSAKEKGVLGWATLPPERLIESITEEMLNDWAAYCRKLSNSSTVRRCGLDPADIEGRLREKVWRCIRGWPGGREGEFASYVKQALLNALREYAKRENTKERVWHMLEPLEDEDEEEEYNPHLAVQETGFASVERNVWWGQVCEHLRGEGCIRVADAIELLIQGHDEGEVATLYRFKSATQMMKRIRVWTRKICREQNLQPW